MVGSGGGELGICLFLQRHREISDFLRLTMKKINFGHYLSKKKKKIVIIVDCLQKIAFFIDQYLEEEEEKDCNFHRLATKKSRF